MSGEQHLTRTQKRLVKEIDRIMSSAGLDYWTISDRKAEYRTGVLQLILRGIARGEVIGQYVLIDEQLSSTICHYLFDSDQFERLWQTKKFERFNYFILEKMSLMEKFAFVKDVYRVPKAIASDIDNINSMRNALAHAFFPENLKAYRTKKPSKRKIVGPPYKGVDIFTFEGLDRFLNDSRRVVHFLSYNLRRKKRSTFI